MIGVCGEEASQDPLSEKKVVFVVSPVFLVHVKERRTREEKSEEKDVCDSDTFCFSRILKKASQHRACKKKATVKRIPERLRSVRAKHS